MIICIEICGWKYCTWKGKTLQMVFICEWPVTKITRVNIVSTNLKKWSTWSFTCLLFFPCSGVMTSYTFFLFLFMNNNLSPEADVCKTSVQSLYYYYSPMPRYSLNGWEGIHRSLLSVWNFNDHKDISESNHIYRDWFEFLSYKIVIQSDYVTSIWLTVSNSLDVICDKTLNCRE